MDLKYRKKIVSMRMMERSVVLNLNGEIGLNSIVEAAPRIIAIQQRAAVHSRTRAGYETI
jgi:hypothetical protein